MNLFFFLKSISMFDFSSPSIDPVKKEHNDQWNCLLISAGGNISRVIYVILYI